MLKNFLEEVVGIAAGKQAEPIADLLHSKKHVNEFLIAKKLDITINQTRNILYKIADYGLVSSERKKDKKKGWYTYFWKINVLKSLNFLKELTLKRIDQFRNQAESRESKVFYVCERCSLEFTEENAMLQDFSCPECGEVFKVKDNSKLIRELKKNLDKYGGKLKLIDEEIEKEEERLEKIKEKERKKLEKEKAEKRAAAKRARDKLKKKTAKKSVKKKTAKKSSGKKAKKKSPKKKAVKKNPKKKSVKKKTAKKSSGKKAKKKAAKKKIVKKKAVKKKAKKRK